MSSTLNSLSYHDEGKEVVYTYHLTLLCSLGVWFSELTSAWLTRESFKRYFGLSVTREAVGVFLGEPNVVSVLICVLTVVEMEVLSSILDISHLS